MQFSPRKNKSKTRCCVSGCKSSAEKDHTVRFHFLPKRGTGKVIIINNYGLSESVDKRYAWEKALKLQNIVNFSEKSRVCSLHFKKDDYVLPDVPAEKRYLKKEAVPSQNLPLSEAEKEKTTKQENLNAQRTLRRKQRSLNKMYNSQVNEVHNNIGLENHNQDSNDEVIVNIQVHSPIPAEINEVAAVNEQSNVLTSDKCVQVEFDVYCDFIRNAKDLNVATGLQSFKLLYAIEKIVKIVSPKTSGACKRKFSKLSVIDKIVLTLMKLKHNMSYSLLALSFKKVSAQNCRQIFLSMISVLSSGLQYAIYWPSKQEVLKNIPLCFTDYENVRAVIDVIEMNIQAPKNVCCQIGTYSAYKGSNTLRYMTAVSPAGNITYLSKAFLGKSSDTAIFNKSDFITKFDKGDALMTDKGFLVDDACLLHEVLLVRPPFLQKKRQFSRPEALLNAKIAKARVHIERSNQRIKIYKILSTRIPAYLIPRIDQIFTIICALVNLSSPILANNKFIKN